MFKKAINESEKLDHALEESNSSSKEYSKEEILEALMVIKTICAQNVSCVGCPLRKNSEGGCMVQSIAPASWRLSSESKGWRAFH